MNRQIQNINENKRVMLRYFDSIINVENNENRKDIFRQIRNEYEMLPITTNKDAIKLDNMIGSVLQLYRDRESFDESAEGRESDNQRFRIIQDWLNRFLLRRRRLIDEFNFAVNRRDARDRKWKAKINQKYEMKFWELDKDAAEMRLREAEIKYKNVKNQQEKEELLERIYENQDDQGLRMQLSRVNNRINSNNQRLENNSMKISKAEELKSIIEKNMDEDQDRRSVVNDREAKKAYKKGYNTFTKQTKTYESMDLYRDAYMNTVNNDMRMGSQSDTNEEIQAYINKKNEQQRNKIIHNFEDNQKSNNQFKNKKEGE